jgi:predicted permease
MPRRFRIGGDQDDLWLPFDVRTGAGGAPRTFVGLARVAPGVDRSSRQALAETIAARMQERMPLPGEPFWDIHLDQKNVAYVTKTTQAALFVLLGAVGFVLLITCANNASLLLSQVGVRQRETAIRAAIGASRLRLFREVLTESVLLAACGGAAGILLASWGVDAIVAAAPPNLAYNATRPIEVDGRIVAVAAGLAVGTGVLFGLIPALRGSSPRVEMILKGGAGGGPGRTAHSRLSGALIVAEVAFSLILLVGAALMVRTFANLHALTPGFDPDGVVAVNLSLPTDKYVGEGARSAFFESLRERLVGVAGVSDTAVARGVFGGDGVFFGTVDNMEGRASVAPSGRIEIPSNRVTAGYFRTLRIPIVAGRTFAATDGEDAVVISKSLADRLWPTGEAVGSRFRLAARWPWHTVVGVVGDVEPRAGDQRTSFHLYRQLSPPALTAGDPPRTRGYAGRTLIVRAAEPAAIIPEIRAAVWTLDRNQPIGEVVLVADLYADSFARERFVLQLMAVFGLIALALTAAGIFGVLSQLVAGRTREIGVRMALGARSADILRLILSRGFLLLAIGVVSGLAGAAALTRFLEALLFEVRPVDPLSFSVVTVVLIAIALFACWLPTRRATRVDPAVALRVE